jgi:hypothetical protein
MMDKVQKTLLRFRGACCLMIEATNTSETSVNLYQITRRNSPEESHLHN